MFLKLLLLISTATFALAVSGPRKLYRTRLANDFSGEVESKIPIVSFKDTFADEVNYRLPNTTKPLHYDVWLKTEIDQGIFDFSGRVSITIEALENTNEIVLHYRQLTIVDVRLLRGTGAIIQSNVPYTVQEDAEFLIVRPTTARLIAGTSYILVINYLSELRDDDAGFYRSSYLDGSGTRRWLATTQFESTDARHAFPCFDEPAIRSSYSIEIQHASTYHALSNMPEISRTPVPDTNHVTTKFDKIESVSSYLIAFIVSDFTAVENLAGRIPQRVFANKQLIDAGYGKLATDVSQAILEGFESYLETEYSLPKMDQAALADFAAGAMENWGLVTYREQYLLFNEATGTARDRENVIATISHEFAHQWFGNLVSPAWWSYLWLNEGFATLYENHILEVVYPGEKWDDTFLVETVQAVMETDANPNIRPMTYYIEDPDSIDRIFDSVAYSKSGSVLKTFQHAFGDSTWRKGLKYYLESRAYNFGTPDDLYEGIQKAVDEDNLVMNRPNVAAIMNTWTTQSGFPFVTVSRDGNSLTFEQNRFTYANRDAHTQLWWIPISYVVESNANFDSTKPDFWLQGVKSVTLQASELPKEITANDWIVVNSQQSFYYRVNYDLSLWRSIFQQLNKDGDEYAKIHTFNRAQLIDDSFHLARAEVISYNTVFHIFNYLEKETEYVPWYSVTRALRLLNRWMSGSPSYDHYQKFMQKNAQAAFLRYGIDSIADEPRVDRYARNIAINIACQAQHPVCLQRTNEKLVNYAFSGGSAPAPDVASTIYCNGMRSADMALFNTFKSRMILSTSASEKNMLMTALGCVQNRVILSEYLEYAITEPSLSIAERSRILASSVNIGEESVSTLIEFVRVNAQALSNFGLINTVFTNIASRVTPGLAENFISLVETVQDLDLLSSNQAANHINNANEVRNWQTINLRSIELFFEGEEETTVPTTTPSTPTPSGAPTTPAPTTSAPTTPAPTTLGAGSIAASVFVLTISFLVKYLL